MFKYALKPDEYISFSNRLRVLWPGQDHPDWSRTKLEIDEWIDEHGIVRTDNGVFQRKMIEDEPQSEQQDFLVEATPAELRKYAYDPYGYVPPGKVRVRRDRRHLEDDEHIVEDPGEEEDEEPVRFVLPGRHAAEQNGEKTNRTLPVNHWIDHNDAVVSDWHLRDQQERFSYPEARPVKFTLRLDEYIDEGIRLRVRSLKHLSRKLPKTARRFLRADEYEITFLRI